jgi:drug/metabolite transporter (DMT)-like permease
VPEASPLLVAVAPAIFLLFWSGGYAAGKVGLGYTGPFTLLAVRYGLVLAILLPLVLVMRPPLPRAPAEWVHLAVVGFLIQGLYFALGYIALATTLSSAAVALILSLQPIFVAIIAPRIAGERVGVWGWIGLDEKRFGVAQHPVTSNAVQYVAGLAVTFPLAWALEEHAVTWSGPFVVALGYLVICNSLIAMTLLLMMIRVGEVSRVSALFFLVPPMAALIGWVVLGEAMPPLAWVGLGLAAAGVALATRADRLPQPRRREAG